MRGYFFEERELLKAVSLEKIVVYNEEKERESEANWRGLYSPRFKGDWVA